MNSSEPKRHQIGEAEEFGCRGLLRGYARNLYTHREISAATGKKSDGPFYCPSCKSDAILHKCTEKADHFAHVAPLSPVLRTGENELHYACKTEICEALAERHIDGKWAVERSIPANPKRGFPELRPDISGRVFDRRVAIEVQASALTPSKIVKRSMAYGLRNIALIWVVPLYGPLTKEPFRPRLYERYLHSLYYGRTYYWWAGRGVSVLPVHYAPARRHVEYREWKQDGEELSGGGYDTTYKVIKSPCFGPDLSLDVDFSEHERSRFVPENERKAVPACTIWRDIAKPWWKDE